MLEFPDLIVELRELVFDVPGGHVGAPGGHSGGLFDLPEAIGNTTLISRRPSGGHLELWSLSGRFLDRI